MHWVGSVDELLEYWFAGEIKLDEQALHPIGLLKKSGVVCIAATNQEKYRTEYLKKMVGIDHYFDHFFSSAQIGYKKPYPEFFEFIRNPIHSDFGAMVYWDGD